jgi:hypothetical protein
MSHYLKEFPDYDAPLPTFEGFVDDSWHNDTCPSLVNFDLNLKLYCDYAAEDKRECGGNRFTLCYLKNMGYIADSDDIEVIKQAIKKVTT